MACRYYDDMLVAKLLKWLPTTSNLRVLNPSESKRLFELTANDNKDKPMTLPLVALSRGKDIELLSTVKQPRSYDGLKLLSSDDGTYQFNVLPIKLIYDLNIYTKTADEADEYVRTFLFKLINNPVIKVRIPYNGTELEHIANIRVMNNVSDTSDISERIFSGQFYCWTIQLEIQDAFLFNIPYRKNWKLCIRDADEYVQVESYLELSELISEEGEQEALDVYFKKNDN